MLKLTVALLTVALAGTASAAGWRPLQLDGSSEAGFERSLAEFREKLTPGRRYAFIRALHDIWDHGTSKAEAEQREYTAADYLRDLDGLAYKQVVTFTDPTGKTARRYLADYNPFLSGDARQRRFGLAAGLAPSSPWPERPAPIGPHGEQVRGIPDTGPMHQWLHRN
jgi:hypothetical protein